MMTADDAKQGASIPSYEPELVIVRLRIPQSKLEEGAMLTMVTDVLRQHHVDAVPQVEYSSLFLPLAVLRIAGTDPLQASEWLRQDPRTQYADPVVVSQRAATDPDDPRFGDQKQTLGFVGVPEAWKQQKGTANVLLAFIDSGIALTADGALEHEDLSSSTRYVLGANFVTTGPPRDNCGHGTHVIGIAAAMTDNRLGIAAVNWFSPVYVVKVFDQDGDEFSDATFFKAVEDVIAYAHTHGYVRAVINYSAGSPIPSDCLLDACRLISDNGFLLSASSGNDHDLCWYPAAFATLANVAILSVGATNGASEVWEGSSPCATVVAPGVEILSASFKSSNSYVCRTGTSASAAMGTGVASLAWCQSPRLSHLEIVDLLVTTASPLPGSQRPDPYSGWGRLNAAAAVGL